MLVLRLERVPASLRGELTRWLLEASTGMFVGRVSAMVREQLWTLVCHSLKGGGAVMAHSTDNEQGFALRTWGTPSREVVDFEGLSLVRVPGSVPEK
ncbi:MAG: type I-E CRISPR-associated endoribonuclease Cas2 [Chloroflexi bacterium]|nr:type I-E CRISPR-associated endoribonuclease Cas2 [Chloroflexota bacterium]